eukprot:1563634-Alexandrium_andersonii.AAC.1
MTTSQLAGHASEYTTAKMWITTPRRFRACASESESQRMKLSAALGRKGAVSYTHLTLPTICSV